MSKMTPFKLSSFSRLHITFIIQQSTLIDAVVIIIIMYRRSISISVVEAVSGNICHFGPVLYPT